MHGSSAEFCRIERWRGYVTSTFFVRLPDGTLLESAAFRTRGAVSPPDDGPGRAAYDELVSRVEALGWARHGDGHPWFATTFTRFGEGRAELPPAVEPEPERPPAPVPDVRAPRPVADRPLPTGLPRRRRRRVAVAVGAAAALAAAASAFAFAPVIHGRDNDEKPKPARRPAVAPKRAARAATPLTTIAARPSASPKRIVVDVRITAHGNGSWVEVRRMSSTGPVLYSTTLTDGQTLHARAPRVWARFGAASNLTITADGRPVALHGTYDKLFLPRR